jgi:hypothetical protein
LAARKKKAIAFIAACDIALEIAASATFTSKSGATIAVTPDKYAVAAGIFAERSLCYKAVCEFTLNASLFRYAIARRLS